MTVYTDKTDYWEYKAKLSYQDLNELAANDEVFQQLLSSQIIGLDVYRVDATNIGIRPGACMVNSNRLCYLSAAKTDLTFSAPDDGDWLDIWATVTGSSSTPTFYAVDSGTAPGGSSNPGTYGIMLGSIYYINSTYGIAYWNRYRTDGIYGWRYFVGNNTSEVGVDIVYGKTFDTTGFLNVDYLCRGAGTPPLDLDDFSDEDAAAIGEQHQNLTTTQGRVSINASTGTFSSSYYYGFMFNVLGRYT